MHIKKKHSPDSYGLTTNFNKEIKKNHHLESMAKLSSLVTTTGSSSQCTCSSKYWLNTATGYARKLI